MAQESWHSLFNMIVVSWLQFRTGKVEMAKKHNTGPIYDSVYSLFIALKAQVYHFAAHSTYFAVKLQQS